MFFGGIPFEEMGGMPGMGGGGMPGMNMPREPADTTELYKVLGVEKTAGQDEIRKAYRKLAIKNHPDKGGDPEEFKKIQAAYEVLKDEEKRAKYDKYGLEGVEDDMGDGGDDLFSSLFGGRRRRGGGQSGPRKGPDVKHPLKVSLEDLYNGKTAKLAVSRDKIVGKAEMCLTCNGRGVIVRMRQIGPGMVQQIQQRCPACEGSGYTFKKEKERKVLEVNIEAGMQNGEKIRFHGMSDEQPNSEPGDIVFLLQEKEHPVFKRKHADLLIHKEITLVEALCGYEFLVEHLDGRKLLIKSRPGEIIRPEAAQGEPFVKCVEGEGMPKKNTGGLEKGNLYIYFNIQFPTEGSLDDAACKALRSALPAPEPMAKFDPETVEVHETTPINLREFGRRDPGAGGDAYDSDDEQGGPRGVQCQQG